MKIEAKAEDIIEINAGGPLFTTTRSTIRQVKDSFLATMFSGRWEESQVKKKGGVFLDVDPDCFEKVLGKLRLQMLSGQIVSWGLTSGPPGKQDVWEIVLRYLGLTASRKLVTFESHCRCINIGASKRTATRGGVNNVYG